jgi:hypothetical protein
MIATRDIIEVVGIRIQIPKFKLLKEIVMGLSKKNSYRIYFVMVKKKNNSGNLTH